MAQGGHVCAGVLTTAVICLTTLCMSSGRSLMTLKDDVTLQGATYPYGIGLLYDQYGYTWDEKESFMQAQKCEDHQHRGRYIKGVSFMVAIVSVLAVLVHSLGSYQGAAWQGLVGIGCQAFNFVFLITALGISANMYDECYWCQNISTKVCLKEYFYLNYAIPFYVGCIIFTIINIVALLAAGSLQGAQPVEEEAKATEPVS